MRAPRSPAVTSRCKSLERAFAGVAIEEGRAYQSVTHASGSFANIQCADQASRLSSRQASHPRARCAPC